MVQLLPMSESSLASASAALRASSLVAFPTETVYGLGASALSTPAVAKIYAAKGRPSDNPLIVHVADAAMARELVPGGGDVHPVLERLMEAFWPGPLTLLFPLAADGRAPPKLAVSPLVTARSPSLAIRQPSHPAALALLKASGLPLAAPSANRSGRPSPTTADHVMKDMEHAEEVAFVLDGGDCDVGVESTVVDFVPSSGSGGNSGTVRILRQGSVTLPALTRALRPLFRNVEVILHSPEEHAEAQAELELNPSTPGMKYRHYAPETAVVSVLEIAPSPSPSLTDEAGPQVEEELPPTLSEYLRSLPHPSAKVGLLALSSLLMTLDPSAAVSTYSLGPTATTAARSLFAGLRELDQKGCEVILVQSVVGQGQASTRRWNPDGEQEGSEDEEEEGPEKAVMERAGKASEGRVIRVRLG